MRKILIYFFLIFVFNSGNNFQAQAGTKGVLQYCIYQGQWSLIFKFEKNFKNNTRWCKIIKKSENPEFYTELFKKSMQWQGKWYIETVSLRRIVDKHEAIAQKYKKMEEEILAKQKASEEKKKQELLAKQKANEERKKQELLAKQKANEEKKKQELLAKKKSEDKKKQLSTKQNKTKDNRAPVIKIANSFTVNDANYEISGSVSDESKKIFIEVDGQIIQVKKGKFTIKRYSPVDEKIKIVAIDQWGNKSKPHSIDIKIDNNFTASVSEIEPLNPKKLRSKSYKNKVALIIGIEKYKQTPTANFANMDAKFFYEYVRKGFGVSKSNIKLLIDEDADLVNSLGTLKKWLPGKVKPGQTELIVFFAGHGLASNDGKELYILPQDSDPDLLERTALSRTELFKEIINLNPMSVTMFMDTCYSGISRDEKMLLASARPIRIVANDEEGIPDSFTIFSASQLDQISSGIKEAKHGIFSYYLMKGLEGYADVNKDKKITNGELLAYMDENISQKASELGRQQNPSLAGDPDKVLISY